MAASLVMRHADQVRRRSPASAPPHRDQLRADGSPHVQRLVQLRADGSPHVQRLVQLRALLDASAVGARPGAPAVVQLATLTTVDASTEDEALDRLVTGKWKRIGSSSAHGTVYKVATTEAFRNEYGEYPSIALKIVTRQIEMGTTDPSKPKEVEVQEDIASIGETEGVETTPETFETIVVTDGEGRPVRYYILMLLGTYGDLSSYMKGGFKGAEATRRVAIAKKLFENLDRAVTHAHEAGYRIPDFKPANILVDVDVFEEAGVDVRALLLDFGSYVKSTESQSSDFDYLANTISRLFPKRPPKGYQNLKRWASSDATTW